MSKKLFVCEIGLENCDDLTKMSRIYVVKSDSLKKVDQFCKRKSEGLDSIKMGTVLYFKPYYHIREEVELD